MKFKIVQMLDEYGEWLITFNGWAKYPYGTAYRDSIRPWCRQTFGPSGIWDTNNYLAPRWKDDIMWGEIRFRDKKDAEWFLLRWE